MAVGEFDAIPLHQRLQEAFNHGQLSNGWNSHSCNCMGPRIGEPLCPCMMRGVEIVDGRYIRTQDLGPVPSWKLTPKDAA